MAVEVEDKRGAEEDLKTSFQAMEMELSCASLPDCLATFLSRFFLVSCSHWKLS